MSVDYMYMKGSTMELEDQEVERDKRINEGIPMLVEKDRRSKTIKVHVLPQKGIEEYASKRLAQDIDSCGYKRIKLKSDQEEAIRALKKEAQKNVHYRTSDAMLAKERLTE